MKNFLKISFFPFILAFTITIGAVLNSSFEYKELTYENTKSYEGFCISLKKQTRSIGKGRRFYSLLLFFDNQESYLIPAENLKGEKRELLIRAIESNSQFFVRFYQTRVGRKIIVELKDEENEYISFNEQVAKRKNTWLACVITYPIFMGGIVLYIILRLKWEGNQKKKRHKRKKRKI